MAKYFKVVEIDADEFINATGEDLDCCQLIIPVNEAVFVAVDEDQEDISKELGVMSTPTIILFKDGKEIKRNIGFMDEETLINFLEDN